MPRSAACPDLTALESILDLAPEDGLFNHLENCQDCQRAVAHLHSAETLQDVVRIGMTLKGTVDPAAVETLVHRVLAATDHTIATPAFEADAVEASLSPPQAPDELGRLGGYRVLRLLGRGGMGAVYLAEDSKLGRRVALKVMLPALAGQPAMKDRFLREARAAAALEHDNITPVYEVGEAAGVPFIAMPFLKGETLAERLTRDEKLPTAEVARIGREIAAGLAAAHRAGLVHRDIKPANIWLDATAGNRVRLVDFGLARSLTDEGLTQSGSVLGTPKYMAPEQARGEAVDGRADLFSLGVVMYHMATGRLPFPGDSVMAVLSALANDIPSPVRSLNPDVPPALANLIDRLLAKSPTLRPANAEAVIAALENLPTTAAAPSRPRRGMQVALAAAVLLAIGVIAYGVSILRYETPDGTLVVEVDDRAEVRFRQGKLQVCDAEGRVLYTLSASEKNKTLPPGKYLVKVVGADGVSLETTEFEIAKGGTQTIRVTAMAPLQPIPAGVPLPEFPGKVVLHDAFDNAAKSPLPQGAGPPLREVRDGRYRVSSNAAKARDLLTIELAQRLKAGAFTLRVRTENAGLWVNFRGQITMATHHRFHMAVVTAQGDRHIKLGQYLWDNGRWGPPTDSILLTVPRDPEMAAGQWITVAARWSDTDYEVWMNGARVGGGAADPAAATTTLSGIQICSRSVEAGPMAIELDAVTVWDQSALPAGETGPKK